MKKTLWAALIAVGIMGLTMAETSFAGGACCALKGSPKAEETQAETLPVEPVRPAVKSL